MIIYLDDNFDSVVIPVLDCYVRIFSAIGITSVRVFNASRLYGLRITLESVTLYPHNFRVVS